MYGFSICTQGLTPIMPSLPSFVRRFIHRGVNPDIQVDKPYMYQAMIKICVFVHQRIEF